MFASRRGVLFAALGLSLAPMAWADDAPKMPSASVSASKTLTATVTAIDYPSRLMTLRGSKGKSVTIHVGDIAKNFEQVKVGDTVVVHYYESYALKVTKPGAPASGAVDAAVSAPPGQLPAGAVLQQESIKAKVTAIGKHRDWVTLKGPEGNSVTIKARDPKNLAGVKVGDDVEVTYTQALAVAIDRPTPARK